MPETVQRLTQSCAALWWQIDAGAIPPQACYTQREQKANELHLKRFLETLAAETKSPPRTELERQAAEERLSAAGELLAKSALGLQDRHFDFFRAHGLLEVAAEFARKARRFDPEISGLDIYQASRNAWAMCNLQLMLDLPVQVTPAIFAYSMLYPYSDNFLDDPSISAQAKRTFNERLAQRLLGQRIRPISRHEEIVWKLVGMIEGQFDRAEYPQVFDSLLAIHRAQNRSVALLRGGASPYEVDVLGISLEKGGTSVLADGYLVAGSLTEAQAEFLFRFGAFLQLLDDLQDVEQDRQDGLMTIFSQTARRWPMDQVTNRTFHFGLRVSAGKDCFEAPDLEPLDELMDRTLPLLLVEAVGRAGRLYYSKPYLREIERFSPFRFSTLRKVRKRLAREQVSLTRLLESFLASPDQEPIPLTTTVQFSQAS
jgi:hypothetical protein